MSPLGLLLLGWARAHAPELFADALVGLLLLGAVKAGVDSLRANAARQSRWRAR